MRDMQYQLQIVRNPQKGRNKKIGSLQRLPDGRIGTFVGYCANNDCTSKICMDFESAREFARRFGAARRKPLNRLTLKLLERLEAKTR